MPEQAVQLRHTLAEHSRRVVDSTTFTAVVFCLIVGNAALLGIETYAGIVDEWRPALHAAESVFLAVFTAEILLRAASHADRPRNFFRDPWNVFDLIIVTAAFLPVVRDNVTVLRLLRLARVARAARFLPQLRIVIVAVVKSLPGTVSFLLVGGLLLYVYAMVGWMLFSDDDPEHYGSLGRAALTLFFLITLEGLGDAVRAGLEISRWTILYFASFVLLGSFLLVNLLIGVVINSLEEARALEESARRSEEQPAPCDPGDLQQFIATARQALDSLETELAARNAPPSTRHRAGATIPSPSALRSSALRAAGRSHR